MIKINLNYRFVYDTKLKRFYIKHKNIFNNWKYIKYTYEFDDTQLDEKFTSKNRKKLLNKVLLYKENFLIKYNLVEHPPEIIGKVNKNANIILRNYKIEKVIHKCQIN
jgi:hypothetical protein